MEQKKYILFSIITVCLNAENIIQSTMESVLSQTWQNFEYIIVDGASKDATLDIVQEIAKNDRRIRCVSEPDHGIFNAMNKGIRRAAGDFLLFLNAGDKLHSTDVLEKAAGVVTEADIVIGDMAYQTETGLSRAIYSAGEELVENLRKGKMVCHQAIFASRQCLKDGFDEHFMFCADYDWLCRQVNTGKKTIKLNAVVVDFDLQGVTFQVRHQKRHWEEYFEVIGRNFPRLEFKYGDEVKALFVQQRKDHILWEFMNRWLALKQKGFELSTFFLNKGIQTIAIYGIYPLGERLYEELRRSKVEVMYVIDRNPKKLEGDVSVLRPDEELNPVDAIVITPILDFLEIKDSLSKRFDCPIFFIEDVLFYGYEKMGD